MNNEAIHTDAAPAAIGTYSQAVKSGSMVFISGQIPLNPATMEVVVGDMEVLTRQVFDNLSVIAKAADSSLDDVVKLTVFLTDLSDFALVNDVMTDYFNPPYPARAAVGVAALPKGVPVEIDAVLHLGG